MSQNEVYFLDRKEELKNILKLNLGSLELALDDFKNNFITLLICELIDHENI